MAYEHLSYTIERILTNRISSIGYKKTGCSVVASKVPKIGTVTYISIVRRNVSAVAKRVVYHFPAANHDHTNWSKINIVDMTYEKRHM